MGAVNITSRVWLWLVASCPLAMGCSLTSNPNVRLNQLGYLPHSSKIAIIESSSEEPLSVC